MFNKKYDRLQKHINPSEDLLKKTKDSMYKELDKKYKVPIVKYIKYGSVAACCVLVISLVYNPLINQVVDKESEYIIEEKRNNVPKKQQEEKGTLINEKEKQEKNIIDNKKTSEISENKEDGITVDKEENNRIKYYETIELSENELYSNPMFGDYLPKKIIKGYKFDSATIADFTGNEDKGRTTLLLNYTLNYNYIMIRVEKAVNVNLEQYVDVKDTKKYDIVNYPIPHAESIPDDLYYTMNYPIFKAEDITKDVIGLRKVVYNELGEGSNTEKTTYRFSIQCGDYIIEYYIKGSNTNAIFDMVKSSKYYTDKEK